MSEHLFDILYHIAQPNGTMVVGVTVLADYILGLREIVGSRPLIMTGATIILLDNQDRILLQQRSDSGYWGLPGGSMELSESFEDTGA